MAEKMTKREAFAKAAEVLRNAGEVELAEVVGKEAALLEARAEKGRGLTKNQKVNAELKVAMVEELAEAETATASDVAGFMAARTGADFSVQKATALLRQLVAEGLVAKTEAKGKEKAQFAVAE